jgi:hypothetical protein
MVNPSSERWRHFGGQVRNAVMLTSSAELFLAPFDQDNAQAWVL